MANLLFPRSPLQTLTVQGFTGEYPVNRIFCVGRNYAAHAAEMGNSVDRDAPWYFCKMPHAVVRAGGKIPYPPMTKNYHYEVELVVALGLELFQAPLAQAQAGVFAYGVGLDMTRRDLQATSKERRQPWDTAKNVEGSAIFTELVPAETFGAVKDQRIHLSVNTQVKQDATLDEMVWSVGEIVSHLSHLYHLAPGDLIMTGTPAGVGPVKPGDQIEAGIQGLPDLSVKVE